MSLTRLRATNILDSDFKNSCRVTAVNNITNLSGGAPNVVESISLSAGDRVLVQGQITASQNGIYRVDTLGSGSNGSWSRDVDASITGSLTAGTLVYVEEGATNGGKFYYISTVGLITLDTTSVSFNQFTSGAGGGSLTIGGLDTQIQFNDSGILAGSSGLTFNKATSVLTVGANVNASNINVGNVKVTTGVYWSNGNAWTSPIDTTTYSNSNVFSYLATYTVPTANAATYVTGLTATNVQAVIGSVSTGSFPTLNQSTTGSAQFVTGLTAANVQAVIGSVSTGSFPTLNQSTTGGASFATYVTNLSSANVQAVIGSVSTASFPILNQSTTGSAQFVTGLTAANVQAVIGSVSTGSFPTLNQNTTGTSRGLTGTPNISVANVTTTGDTTIGGNLTVVGNLVLQGNSTVIGSQDLTINDSVINLHTYPNLAPWTVNDGRDIGFKLHYYDSTLAGGDNLAFLGRVNTSGFLEYYTTGTENSSNVFSSGTYGTIKTGELVSANSTASTSTSTGALRVSGGVGIAGNLNVGGTTNSFTGNVGIGTNTPSESLTISRSTGEAVIGIRNTGTASAWLTLSPGSAGSAYIHNIGNTATVLTTNSIERLRIDASGNVMVGIASSSTKFMVSGTASSTGTIVSQVQNLDTGASSVTQFNVYHGSGTNITLQTGNGYTAIINTTSAPMLFFTNNSERMRIDASGNVGIGTTSPSSFGKFAVTGSAGTTYVGGAGDQLAFSKGGTNYITTATAGGQIQFQTGAGSNAMLLDSSGNVGIGTSSPAQKLHVVGNIVATGDVTTAYSDDRLKDISGPITDALNKVNTLTGFYYTPNKLAVSLGIDNQQSRVGVSAQKVKEILPEVVKESPINSEYLTVQYEKLVPLLIEAIKDLTTKVAELEKRIE